MFRGFCAGTMSSMPQRGGCAHTVHNHLRSPFMLAALESSSTKLLKRSMLLVWKKNFPLSGANHLPIILRAGSLWGNAVVCPGLLNCVLQLKFSCMQVSCTLGRWVLEKAGVYNPLSGVTSNQSEAFNCIMTLLQNWREIPIDAAGLALYYLQAFF